MVCRVEKFLLYRKVLTHVLITLTFPCLVPYLGLNAWPGQIIHDIERKVCQKAHHIFLLVLWKLVSVRSPIPDTKPMVKTSNLNRINSYLKKMELKMF